MKNLWLLSEEKISEDILELIHWVCKGNVFIDYKNIDYKLTIIDKKLFYQIIGVTSDTYDNFYYGLVSRNANSFVDYLIFSQENPPDQSSIPFAAAEATKNNGKESGNMTSQRAPKKISILEKWGNIPYAYLISNPKLIEKTLNSFGQSHNCDFATMKYFGADILISQIGGSGYETYEVPFEYQTIEDVFFQENSKRKRKDCISSIVFPENNVIKVQANLHKNIGIHDPGEGYVASRVYLCRLLNPSAEIRIVNHKRDLKYFQRKNNKLINTLKTVGVTIEFPDGSEYKIEKESGVYDKSYWKYTKTGEKIATIVMEREFIERGWEILFENHASCGKSYLSIGSQFHATKKTKGIPDLVLYKRDENLLYVIEGETSKNYKKGLIQCREQAFDDFIENEILSRLPSETKVFKYLCTYGKYNQEPEVLFNLTEDFEMNYNWNAQEIV
jgi:hypothetical protein